MSVKVCSHSIKAEIYVFTLEQAKYEFKDLVDKNADFAICLFSR